MKVEVRDRIEALEERFRRGLHRLRWPFNGALGYGAGLSLSAIEQSQNTNAVNSFAATFFGSSIQSTASVTALAIALCYLTLPALDRRSSRRTVDVSYYEAIKKYVGETAAEDQALEGLAWGLGRTVLSAPRHAGWATKEIRFRVDQRVYSFQSLEREDISSLSGMDLVDGYRGFRDEAFRGQFATDGIKYMLVRRPTSFSDDIGVTLEVRTAYWSQLQYFWQTIVPQVDPGVLLGLASKGGEIPFPSSLCLHLVVFSAEGTVLLSRAHSSKWNDHPESWACSIGEQLSIDDIDRPDVDCARLWVERALHEELAVGAGEIDGEPRFHAITFEGDIANFAFVATVHLILSAEDIHARLATSNRLDNEFGAIDFLSLDDIPAELVAPSRTYHPSSHIRMMYAYISRRSQVELRHGIAKQLARART
ncbi:hypothetical protein GCM10011331_23660 [Flavimobilis marinus]|uniref:Uncharacterized protein n=1 Tax=Flavimobilis marinus TaxID=285351 RepID=A0A1I2GJR7_9MICO|nr:hypothetical protein [Flavimobilis marinus]GHG56293.1 hypothetical protein GCM10011331_23660 [Flavimobilis marinus]SFF17483.1 hypothetical protein SAMN04488035_1804 [Flavimobilis marinus]